jgi:hypothetical protein
MDRLLALLFSVTLIIATSPPRVGVEGCDYSGGICVVSKVVKDNFQCILSFSCEKGTDDGTEDSGCSMPACCVSSSCCCLCLVPEQPQICGRPVLIQEKRIKPGYYQGFYPQEVDLSIWKPPSFVV